MHNFHIPTWGVHVIWEVLCKNVTPVRRAQKTLEMIRVVKKGGRQKNRKKYFTGGKLASLKVRIETSVSSAEMF